MPVWAQSYSKHVVDANGWCQTREQMLLLLPPLSAVAAVHAVVHQDRRALYPSGPHNTIQHAPMQVQAVAAHCC